MHPTPVIRVGELPWFSWVGAAGFLLSPFYLLSSGLPQPSDWLLFLFSTLVFIAGGLKFTFPVEARSILSWLLGLLAIIAVVNTTWTGLTGNLSMLKPVSYYIFNVLVTFSLVSYFHRVGFHVLRGVSYLIIATVLIQILLIPVVATGSLRQILFFNNPNQLAYFAVVCGSMVYAANVVFPIRKSILFAFIAACCVLAFLSVSRAGSIAMLTLIMLFFLHQPLVILFLGVGILGVLYGLEFQLENVDEVESRFRDLQADSDRGYHRVYQYPEYLILGVGEGMPSRFNPGANPQEFHSSIGNLWFSYGIAGILSFAAMMTSLFRLATFRLFLALAPAMVFGLTHYGLRTNLFWLLFAYILCLAIYAHQRQNSESEVPEAAA